MSEQRRWTIYECVEHGPQLDDRHCSFCGDRLPGRYVAPLVDLEAAERRVAEAQKALEPFLRMADHFGGYQSDPAYYLRFYAEQARSALSTTEEPARGG